MSDSPPGSVHRSNAGALLTLLLFVALLAGQFDFARVGMDNPLLIPERLFAALALTWLALTMASRRGPRSTPVWPSHLLMALAPLIVFVTSSAWSPPGAELGPVWVDLTCMVLYSVTFVVLLAWDMDAVITTLMWCLWVTGGLFAVAGLAASGAGARATAFGGGPNVYSRVTDLGLVGLAWLISTGRIPTWTLVTAPVLLAATVASGSRGGMLAGILCLLVLSPLVTQLSPGKLIMSSIVAMAGSVAVFRRFGDVVTETVQGRVVELTLQQGYSSGRDDLLVVAGRMFEERPLSGYGLRSFATTYGNGFTYPHNLLAEVAAEAGLLGLLPLLIFLGMVVGVGWRNSGSIHVRCLSAATSVILTSSMFSGDYFDARFLWVFGLGVLAAGWAERHPAAQRSTGASRRPSRPTTRAAGFHSLNSAVQSRPKRSRV
ncbi:O-antigen ligase family protein [Knoellia sp. Soil729]|uniref:O-antigen ligase family protein n=1 Tax=Knoellia sp. Soil729 TaxID=1736394 RepID=UPI0006FEBA8D|nr:O-antigen ligase family protein [Knoellia sp. Soil729]KRE43817.1 hypothetical protein ASG74_02965 [Knoellia sp. Soil729]